MLISLTHPPAWPLFLTKARCKTSEMLTLCRSPLLQSWPTTLTTTTHGWNRRSVLSPTRSTTLTLHWCPVFGAEACSFNHSLHMVDLLGRRFMMSDHCLLWQLAKAHRAFPLSIPPSVSPTFALCFFYSIIFSSLPQPRLILSPSFLSPSFSLCGWHNMECLWFLWEQGIQCWGTFPTVSSAAVQPWCFNSWESSQCTAAQVFSAAQAKC